jgi:thiol-disulfide isomerase/thioredoxin
MKMSSFKRFISVVFIVQMALLSCFAQQADFSTTSNLPLSPSKFPFVDMLDGALFELVGHRLKPYSVNKLNDKKYVVLYFSAQWCPACRVFTPRLKAFYENAREMHDNFEVIFISSDRSEQEMLTYIKNTEMPWPVVNYNELKNIPEIQSYSGPAIPCLVLLDNQGNVLSHTFEPSNDSPSTYIGPEKVVIDLGNRLLSETK